MNRLRAITIAAGLACLLSARPTAMAFQINLDRPGDREFVRDLAGLLNEPEKQKIRQLCDKLLTEKATPILVVTIDSMAARGGEEMRIETFATLLFNQWQIGQAEVNRKTWNTGILLLVSVEDRKARIELGAGWGGDKDDLCRQIMQEQIIPRFAAGDFPGGILAGVEALDKMARGLKLPTPVSPPRPTWHYLAGAAFVGLMIFTAVSLIRRGAGGWAWLLWGAVFAILGVILYQLATRSRRGGSSGGGFSGGSFGGGFSGGGGASGSW